ncbi:hypothetical protein, partial [Paenibacillus glycanilyticus]|uniref:hypothetical protein n=1 Tax=Paenibacillus glycanilyticus TaxID=126569 RepID=UPI00295E7CB0
RDENSQPTNTSSDDMKDEQEKPQLNEDSKDETNYASVFVIDDYMSMNDSIEKFSAFVNKRSDFTAEDKKKIITARSRQLEITSKLMKEYKTILTKEEMDAYLVQPTGEALEPGVLPENNLYDQAVKKIEDAKKRNSEISQLTKELNQVKGGILKRFTDKVQKEKSKLLGF